MTLLAAFSGCAALPPAVSPESLAPVQWSAPLPGEAAWPHEGRLASLIDWWKQQGDGVAADLIEAAQAASPSLASAASRRAQAMAERVAAGSMLAPQLDLLGSAQRRSEAPSLPAGQLLQGVVQLSWELDVFGGQRSQRQAAQWRLQSADAAWHEARVSLAADVALQVLSWRHCTATLRLMHADAQAVGVSAELQRRLSEAGLLAPEQAALAEAAAGEARNRARAQAQRCEGDIKALVMLTAWPEPRLRARLRQGQGSSPSEAAGHESDTPAVGLGQALRHVPALPAATLAQRPDVFVAAASVAAAAADVGAQHAQRYPRLGLSGSVGRLRSESAAGVSNLDTWSVGPLSLSLPVFDGGRRAAQEDAARARYDEARAQHQAVVRRAVREVEDALTALETTAAQARDAQLGLENARAALRAVQQRAQRGLASTLEVQEWRRRALAAELSWLDLQRNRHAAWVGLYRAAGGGWTPPPSGKPSN